MGWMHTTTGQRALGLLSQLRQPRVKDRVKPLVESGAVNNELVRAWSALRPRAAHAVLIDIDSAGKKEIQDMLDQIGRVTTLMYQMKSHLIGYREKAIPTILSQIGR